ncbi:MAG: GTP cyclohydrolase II RibA [Streptomycetales bacterium]
MTYPDAPNGQRATVRARVPITLSRARGGPAELVTFDALTDQREHLACVLPPLPDPPLVRVHSECLTGDLLGSTRCDCGPQLDEALRALASEGGILLYLRQEGRGIGLYNKLDTYLLQDRGVDTFHANELIGRGADEREYGVAAEMLAALGVYRVRLLTNNPDKARQLHHHGIEIADVRSTKVHLNPDNVRYLRAKAEIGGQLPLLRPDGAIDRMSVGEGR